MKTWPKALGLVLGKCVAVAEAKVKKSLVGGIA
jgi:hypothetical protein